MSESIESFISDSKNLLDELYQESKIKEYTLEDYLSLPTIPDYKATYEKEICGKLKSNNSNNNDESRDSRGGYTSISELSSIQACEEKG